MISPFLVTEPFLTTGTRVTARPRVITGPRVINGPPVITGLDPVIHAVKPGTKPEKPAPRCRVGGRVKPNHDMVAYALSPMPSNPPTTALVLFSGGQDSTTCLAWALSRYDHVETIGFDYGQRHAVELTCRAPIRDALRGIADWDARLGPDHLVDLKGAMAGVGETAMTAEIAIQTTDQGLPNTFVPGRNLMFLTAAAAVAWRRGVKTIVGGMCETDYSGYPDCRDDALKAMQVALNIGMQSRFVIETPLMWIDKAATWAMADQLGGPPLVQIIAELTHTCYLGDRQHKHAWGYGCGTCPACELREAGWQHWSSNAS